MQPISNVEIKKAHDIIEVVQKQYTTHIKVLMGTKQRTKDEDDELASSQMMIKNLGATVT